MANFYVTQDVFTRYMGASANYHDSEYSRYLCLGRANDPDQKERIFLGFDLSSLSGKIVDKAILNLYQFEHDVAFSNALQFYVECIASPWSDDTLTWNNSPTASATARQTKSLSGNSNGWRSFDISPLLQDIIHNYRTFYGLRLMSINESIGATEKRFRGLEYGSGSYKAYLDIDYHSIPIKLASAAGNISKQVLGMKIAPSGGSAFKNVTGMNIVSAKSGSFKTVF